MLKKRRGRDKADRKSEADKADARIREFKEEEVRRVSEMKKSFEKNSAAWQEEIFRKVISGNDE